ncbi:SDR family oxidoreductase [Nocardia beijingensis]|uniref:SDR family oxidoreductase n=1 Tax=Nocardia beijingensis TaxID=95162 RepID=UPI0018943CC9|nr:SDR family oxidoreductase [Nocardia beijingensis]MBF6076691.1 SDR family oxidoreductase [Nocardia beijingensis]
MVELTGRSALVTGGVRGIGAAVVAALAKEQCSIHPGPIHPPMTAAMDESVAANQPLARFGQPEEVDAMVRFLATEATYSTGSELVLDGGVTAGQVLGLPDDS